VDPEIDLVEHPFYFRTGLATSADDFNVIAQIGILRDAGSAETEVLRWNASTGWSGFSTSWAVTRLARLPSEPGALYGLGPGGRVFRQTVDAIDEQEIDSSDTGPRVRGDMRDLAPVGGTLFAAGMSRQVYRLSQAGWTHVDSGVVEEEPSTDAVGFNAIHGTTEDELYAVGMGGEIWLRTNGKWAMLSTPTNLVLCRVLATSAGTVVACGQKGLILLGSRESWRVIENNLTEESFWGLEQFDGQVFLSTDKGIYRLWDERLEPVALPFGSSWTFRHLSACEEAIYSFGTKHIASTTDGVQWVDRTPGR